jgi:MFS family permease
MRNRFFFHWINRDGKLIMASRAISTFARSTVAVLMAIYLEKLGFSLVQIGAFLSAGVAGSAVFTVIVGLISERIGRRRLLVTFSLLSAGAGVALIFFDSFVPLLFIAFLGSISGGPVMGPTGPLEQASITETAPEEKRTDLFAIYRIAALVGTALGALAISLPVILQDSFGIGEINSYRIIFGGFAVFLVAGGLLYTLLSSGVESSVSGQSWANPLHLPSRRLIFTLTGLFSLDHFAGSLFMEGLAAYWFYTRFGMDLQDLALVFFVSRLLAAISLWAAAKIANRIGLINTMVFTHIPASLFLIGAAFAPAAWLAIIFWQLRAFFSMMDVPTRDSYTMSIVQPHERVAMASIHIVGRSIAGTVGPLVGTLVWQLLSATAPLVGSAVLKISYDLSLYFMFRNIKPPQERDAGDSDT